MPLHIRQLGGSIHCIEGLSRRIFGACSANQYKYTADLHIAKSYLNFIENNNYKFLLSIKMKYDFPFLRKTTLLCEPDVILSSIDLARVIRGLDRSDLTECEIACEWVIARIVNLK